MRMRITLLLLLASSLQAGEVLDNAAVARMVRAGLSIDVVMTKIAQSQTTFDTSVDALISLKGDGVPDPVIKAMLVKAPAAEPVTPVAPATVEQPKPTADSLCVHVQYYTLAGTGWGWTPSLLCASATGIDIDEQNIPYDQVKTHCFLLSALPRSDKEWWFSDGTDTYKFQARGNELQSISDFIARVRSGIPHGSCGDRSLRKLMPATHLHSRLELPAARERDPDAVAVRCASLSSVFVWGQAPSPVRLRTVARYRSRPDRRGRLSPHCS